MPKKGNTKLPRKALAKLSDLGAEEYQETQVKYRGAIPTSLTDVLIAQLRPSIRTKVAKRLINIATEEGNPRIALDAIKEIYDRIEGRATQSIRQSRAADDPLLALLQEAFKDEPSLVTTKVVDTGFRLLTETDDNEDS